MTTVFGPVPSRRLGRSLGIDVIPAKTCSFDCVYCESGRTTNLTIKRHAYVPPDQVIEDLEGYFQKYPHGADVLTFSGAGEPTLYEPMGELLQYIKRRFVSLPLVVLTNASLLWDEQVRKDLMLADRVVPSLDAATRKTFLTINRPHPDLDLSMIFEGLQAFRMEYRGNLCLEVMLVAGQNDGPDELMRIRELIDRLSPDQIELNTVVRPPAFPKTLGLSPVEMASALKTFPREKTRIIGVFQAHARLEENLSLERRIVELVRRRPCAVPEMATSLGVTLKDLNETLLRLQAENRLTRYVFNDVEFICARTAKKSDCAQPAAALGASVVCNREETRK